MQEYQNNSQVQGTQQRKVRQAVSPEATSLPRELTQQVLQLQRTFGNRKVGQFLQSKQLTPQGKIPGLQRKLTVGAANDQYEQEADRVARQVLSMSDATAATPMQRAVSPEEDKEQKIQTKPVAPAITPFVQRQGQDEERDEAIQTKSTDSLSDSFEAGAEVETQLSQSKGQGSPLPDSVRTYMEPRFGTDFSRVRAHTGSAAVQMNRSVGAQAFAHGSDIYYGEGRSPTNLELTAHELTHVVQQTGKLQNKPIAQRRLLVQRAAEDAPQMDAELQACLAAEPFDRMRAAELLNGFNREDLLARLKPLSAERIAEIHQGALENPVVGPDSQVALLTQATPAEVSQGDTGAGGAGPVPPIGDVGTGGAPGSGHDGTDGSPGVEVPPETDTDVPPTTDVGTGGAPDRGHEGTDGVPGVEVPEEIDDEMAVELVHDALDVAGLAPGPIGVVTDGLNACIYAKEGDWTNAGLSAASVVLSLAAGMGGGVVLIEGVIKISKTAMAKRGVKAAKEWIADAFKAAKVRRFAFATHEVWQYTGRDGHPRLYVIMKTSEGPRGFYQRSGTGLKPSSSTTAIGDWVPFDGFEGTIGGVKVSKGHYYTELAPRDRPVPREFSGYGNQELKEIGMWLDRQEITPTHVIDDHRPIQKSLEDLGAKVSVKHFEEIER